MPADILDLCLHVVNRVTVHNFQNDVLLIQANARNEVSVWFYSMPNLLPKHKQIQLERDIRSHRQEQHACVLKSSPLGNGEH